ncbi:unnamed protein product [Meloidogyne enterolobii]|uniref:Uncharacterized protein n=2 Tax=Meloidogyne enterolobii TaxID=390850 RepID=A0A6V7XE79_MELEN|nr:unnamed protein product [Meloidogyne enterolobii]
MSSVNFIVFLLLISLICLHSLVDCGIIGLAGAPVEATWCAALGKESTHCPQGANSNPLVGLAGGLTG